MSHDNNEPTLSGSFLYCRGLNQSLREQAAGLALKANPSFYGTLGDEVLLKIIASEFLEDGCELSETIVYRGTAQVDGILAAYPASELKKRQQASLHHLVSQLGRDKIAEFLKMILHQVRDLPQVPPNSLYLARISVRPELRSKGVADQLMANFLSHVSHGDGWSLHVDSNNQLAIAFYKRHGFRPSGIVGRSFIAMHRAR